MIEKVCLEYYRFAFNGKETDKEWGGSGIQDYGFRLYNPAIGKFLSVDPLAPDYPWYTPYQFAGNKPINSIDLDGLEEVGVIDMFFRPKALLTLSPSLSSTEWTKTDRQYVGMTWDRIGHGNSFVEASYHNTLSNNSDLYSTVAQRHAYYRFAHQYLNAHQNSGSAWFKAAAVVTDTWGVGGTEFFDFGLVSSGGVDKFLQEGNEFLFEENMANARELIISGRVRRTFTDANGDFIDLSNLSGLALDNALVQFEQTLVEEFTTNYFLQNPDVNETEIRNGINGLFNSMLGDPNVKSVIENNFTNQGVNFDFSNYNHRVTLGQELIRQIRETDNIQDN